MKPTQPWVKLVGRIAGSYAIAVLAAGASFGLFLTLLVMFQSWGDMGWVAVLLGPLLAFLTYGGTLALMMAIYALVPFVLAISALRFFNLGGWISHALAGSIVGMIAVILAIRRLPDPDGLWLMPIPGVIVGIVYWAAFRYVSKEPLRSQETIG